MERKFKIRCSSIGKIMGNSKPAGGLSVTCQTYLKEWYSNEQEQIHSKYLDKGNLMENDCIDFAVKVLDLGFAMKNTEPQMENEYFTGNADVVLSDTIIDTKCPFNIKSLQSNIDGIDSDYEWQLRGYMHLYNKPKAILFYGLMSTPEEVNHGVEVSYDDLPDNERWIAYKVDHDQSVIDQVISKVEMCREWLKQYDVAIKSKIGKLN